MFDAESMRNKRVTVQEKSDIDAICEFQEFLYETLMSINDAANTAYEADFAIKPAYLAPLRAELTPLGFTVRVVKETFWHENPRDPIQKGHMVKLYYTDPAQEVSFMRQSVGKSAIEINVSWRKQK